MRNLLLPALAALAASALAFGQASPAIQDGFYQVGYAVNLTVGDSVVNLSNDGFNGGPGNGTVGNICANTYVFDPQEEEVSCCSCLVTPNGLNSLSATKDLISDTLTPAIPTSIVIKLVSSVPGQDSTHNLTVCNPATVNANILAEGLVAWGSTLEPDLTPGTYEVVQAPFLQGSLNTASNNPELTALTTVCGFIQANGSGFGVCNSCRTGALGGTKN
ncbi:MAG: hypothetical protein ABSB35_40805 [Bryobacteraceae bacterium]|jgi:hypothetical protein